MTAQIIDGKLSHSRCVMRLRGGCTAPAAGKQKPTLATVLVGDRPDSAAYVAAKGKRPVQELGMGSISEHLPADAQEEQVEKLVRKLNADQPSMAFWCSCRCRPISMRSGSCS
jgi:methylenetetrahydrofolate dehydrogenase (NADP+) / methenyltetrahydrofolate cyclohydrolase